MHSLCSSTFHPSPVYPRVEGDNVFEVSRMFSAGPATGDLYNLSPSALNHLWCRYKWETRTAKITDSSGKVAFQQDNVEFPADWSMSATNIVASKYFRGKLGSPEREHSVKQLVSRVACRLGLWAFERGYLRYNDALAFRDEIAVMLLEQVFSFNSPVWFNVGVTDTPQASACFIVSVEDDMDSILGLAANEARIFKSGSGAGSNLSVLRSSKEHLKGGGIASGPVSFMRGFDAFAGVIKSGGKNRRAAKLVCLNDNHPDILDFVRCKAIEEKKAHALIDAGYDGSFNVHGGAYDSVSFQNANHSVRASDEFMRAVEAGKTWDFHAVTTGEVLQTVNAADVWKEIGEAAWVCGDPGLQFDTTANEWHTSSNSGRINASNPCCFVGETLVRTNRGNIRIDELCRMSEAGEPLPTVAALKDDKKQSCQILRAWKAGDSHVLATVRFGDGMEFVSTPEHRYLTSMGYMEARDLRPGMLCRTDAYGGGLLHVESVTLSTVQEPVAVYDIEVENVHNFPITQGDSGVGVYVHNSEFFYLDDTACNLASLNLMKFLTPTGLDVERFKHAVRLVILAQEILVGVSKYPTDKITYNSHKFRPLGLGYANLGAYLMASGLAYDSEGGRSICSIITALMTGTAYKTSAEIASVVGPCDGWFENVEPIARVMSKHRAAASVCGHLPAFAMDPDAAREAEKVWIEVEAIAKTVNGFRNMQASVLAPAGTISFMMDCDTTGIEPGIALVSYKKLVGGGSMKIVNQTVPAALKKLGYTSEQSEAILKHIEANDTIEGAPYLQDRHLPVFDCAFRAANGKRAIHYMGHLRMMAAAQPFLSGAISKTVNMPGDATPEDICNAYMQAWKLGLKAVAVYRDGCKRTQPLSTTKETGKETVKEAVNVTPVTATRVRLPDERQAVTHKFSIGGHDGYITAGMYPDGTVGELFINISKQGSTVSGLCDSLATMVSIGLQYGVPLEKIVEKLKHMSYEPSGYTGNEHIRYAKSLSDYAGRWLELKFLKVGEAEETVGAEVRGQRAAGELITGSTLTGRQLDAPPCTDCGSIMVRNGACYKCVNCGGTSGCS